MPAGEPGTTFFFIFFKDFVKAQNSSLNSCYSGYGDSNENLNTTISSCREGNNEFCLVSSNSNKNL